MDDNSSITMAGLMAAKRRLGPVPKQSDCLFPVQMYGGIKVVEVPVRMEPKIQIKADSRNFCSDEFRDKMNVWLLKRFGSRDVSPIQPGMAFMMGSTVLVRPEMGAILMNCTA